jgi:hypothetical protein
VSGHVFHPGHHELHGVTVVIDARDGRTIVGRFHDVEGGRLRLHDAAVRDAAAPASRDEFLRRTLKFGVPPEHRLLTLAEAEVERMAPLRDVTL